MTCTTKNPVLLIIDDDPAIRILVSEALTPHGFIVEQAESGESGLLVYQQIHPDIVLLDINMSGIDGIATCRRIRALPQGEFVPVLIFTGSDDARSIHDAYQAGATDFITKPINWSVLIHHVRYMLRAGQAITAQHHVSRLQALRASLMELKCGSFDTLADIAVQAIRIIAAEPLVRSCCRSCAIYLFNADELSFAGQTDPGVTDYPAKLNGMPGPDFKIDDDRRQWYSLSLTGADQLFGVLVFSPFHRDVGAAQTAWLFSEIAERLCHLFVRAQAELEIQLTASVFANTLDGIAVTDAQGVLLRVNRAFEQITGYSAREVVGKKISLLKSSKQDVLFYRSMWNSLIKTGRWQGEIWNRRKNGDVFPEWLSISAVLDAQQGRVIQYIAVFTDISNQKAQEQKIRKLAYFDGLTGLANRTLLNDHLQLALAQSDRTADSVALLFIDLDRFKSINDTLGHAIGDQLLITVAQRLKNIFREADTVARQGGDEFIVLLTNLAKEKSAAEQHVVGVAEYVRKTLAAPIYLDHQELTVSGSIGIAFYPHDAASGSDLIKHADTAMYAAKEKGSRFKLFHPSMAEKERQRFTMETLLKKALENDEFDLHYQPQVDLERSAVIGAECLIRWSNEKLGAVSPMDFIPLAEEIGLINEIGDWVLIQACARLSAWERSGWLDDNSCRYLAVNVSPRQFAQKDFAQRLRKIILASGLGNLSMLELELTEGCLMYHSYESIRTLAQLRDIGVRISIDDFGTGYSSLSYLRNFPLDTLKIDQSFIRDCIDDGKSRAIVKAIVSMADGLGLSTIAEGVENHGQLRFLQNQGCQVMQGYLFSKPLAIDQFEHLLTNKTWDFRAQSLSPSSETSAS